MQTIKVGPVPGYEDMQFLSKPKPQPKRLKWHTSYGSIFVYDDQGNSCTIQRGDADNIISENVRDMNYLTCTN